MKKSILKSIDLLLSFNLKKSISFFIFLLIAILFETLSVALILPLVDIVTSKEGSDYYDLLQRFNFLKIENIFLFSLIAFLFIILIKTLYLIFFSWWKNDFISELNTSFSSKLFHQYLSKSYLDLSKTDISIITRNCWEEVRILTGGLNNLFLLFVEFLVFSSIVIVLFLYDPKTSIFVFIFFLIIGLSFIYLTKGKITQWSKSKIFLTSNIIKSINECFGLIKYIRLRNKENFFFSRFNHSVLRLNRLTRNLSFIREIPKNILEMIAILSLFFVVLLNLDLNNGVSNNLISLVAIYAGAAFRILPAINRIINLVQAFYNYIPTLDILYGDLVSKKNSKFFNNLIDDNKFQFKDIIEFKNVYFKYDDQEDYVKELSSKSDWDYSLVRPEVMIGFSQNGGALTALSTFAIYACICAEMNVPFHYPGNVKSFEALNKYTDAEILGNFEVWVAENDKCKNEAFNITVGSVFSWSNIWDKIADYFDAKRGVVMRFSLTDFLSDKGYIWDRIVEKNDLQKLKMDQLASWPFADWIVGRDYHTMLDDTKRIQFGFTEVRTHEEAIFGFFKRLQKNNILP